MASLVGPTERDPQEVGAYFQSPSYWSLNFEGGLIFAVVGCIDESALWRRWPTRRCAIASCWAIRTIVNSSPDRCAGMTRDLALGGSGQRNDF
jgi:hypothetical protein